jgi:hypothetical protein
MALSIEVPPPPKHKYKRQASRRNLLLANYPTLIFTEVRQCRKRWKSTPITLSSLIAGT